VRVTADAPPNACAKQASKRRSKFCSISLFSSLSLLFQLASVETRGQCNTISVTLTVQYDSIPSFSSSAQDFNCPGHARTAPSSKRAPTWVTVHEVQHARDVRRELLHHKLGEARGEQHRNHDVICAHRHNARALSTPVPTRVEPTALLYTLHRVGGHCSSADADWTIDMQMVHTASRRPQTIHMDGIL
jgi:hypothetical protein